MIVQCETCKIRQQLLDWLAVRPMYLSELAQKSKLDRGMIAYHLGQMEHDGLLNSQYKLLDSKKAARFYSPKITVSEGKS